MILRIISIFSFTLLFSCTSTKTDDETSENKEKNNKIINIDKFPEKQKDNR